MENLVAKNSVSVTRPPCSTFTLKIKSMKAFMVLTQDLAVAKRSLPTLDGRGKLITYLLLNHFISSFTFIERFYNTNVLELTLAMV